MIYKKSAASAKTMAGRIPNDRRSRDILSFAHLCSITDNKAKHVQPKKKPKAKPVVAAKPKAKPEPVYSYAHLAGLSLSIEPADTDATNSFYQPNEWGL